MMEAFYSIFIIPFNQTKRNRSSNDSYHVFPSSFLFHMDRALFCEKLLDATSSPLSSSSEPRDEAEPKVDLCRQPPDRRQDERYQRRRDLAAHSGN